MSSDALARHCIELLEPLGRVRARRMFGGHGLYLDGLFIAIVAFDRLYLKAGPESAREFAAHGCEPFTYLARGREVRLHYWTAPAEALDSPAAMAPWARLALQAALAAQTSRPRPRGRRG